jgi:hypothetical protein
MITHATPLFGSSKIRSQQHAPQPIIQILKRKREIESEKEKARERKRERESEEEKARERKQERESKTE